MISPAASSPSMRIQFVDRPRLGFPPIPLLGGVLVVPYLSR